MAQFGLLNSIILAGYLTGMIAIGIAFSGRQTSTEQYFLAGRKMPWLVVGMSMFASLTSASTFIGVPGMIYGGNIALLFGVLISPVVAPLIIFVFYPFYHRLRITTSYEYLSLRFGKAARITASVLFVLARLSWMGIVIYAPALALSLVTNLHIAVSILLMGVLATVYTALGGLAAVIWTDVVQFVILVAGAAWVAVALGFNVQGGVEGIFKICSEAGKLNVISAKISFTEMTAVSAAIFFFFNFLQDYGTDQVTVQRLIAVKDLKSTAKAVFFNAASDVLINAVLIFIGMGLFAYYSINDSAANLDAQQMLPYYIVNVLPAGVSGLVITAIFAAAMSSMDSGINSIVTVAVNDFIKPFRKKIVEDRKDLATAKWLTLVIGTFSTISAFLALKLKYIIEAWGTYMGLFSAPILGLFLLGILTRRANFTGWLIATIAAISTTIILQKTTNMNWVWYFPISFSITYVIGYSVSVLIRSRPADADLTIYRK